ALDRTHGLAGFVIVEADALGAELRIDHIDVFALADRLVGALGLAGAAVDALFGDVSRHFLSDCARILWRAGRIVNQAAVPGARFPAPRRLTATSFETPGSSIVMPHRRSAISMVRRLCVMMMNWERSVISRTTWLKRPT